MLTPIWASRFKRDGKSGTDHVLSGCGTHLFSAAESRPHLVFVRAGTLDDPEIARPEITIWTSQAPSWARIADDIPRLEHQAPPAA